jgi:hypothetical protein
MHYATTYVSLPLSECQNAVVTQVCSYLCKHLLSGRVSLIYLIAGTALNRGLIKVLCPQEVYPIYWGRVTGTFCPQGVHCRYSEPIEARLAAVHKDQ